MRARQVLEQTQLQSRADLQELEKVVDYVARMPGQRTVVLVSPGFLSRSEQSALDRIIHHALHAQVVISSLDPRGLSKPLPEGDVSRTYLPSSGQALSATGRLEEDRESAARDVLQQVAQGTGGEFVHDTNDISVWCAFTVLTQRSGYLRRCSFAPYAATAYLRSFTSIPGIGSFTLRASCSPDAGL